MILGLCVLAGCLENRTVLCGDRVCSPDLVCAPSGNRCVLEMQVVVCNGMADGAACAFGDAWARVTARPDLVLFGGNFVAASGQNEIVIGIVR